MDGITDVLKLKLATVPSDHKSEGIVKMSAKIDHILTGDIR
jgi:hypothetical protein